MDPIYLDHNATTPLLPDIVDAMLPYLRTHFGNPSSGHVYGQRAKAAVARAREQVAALLGCEADEVYFTSGGTEANNLALHGAAETRGGGFVTSVIEHPATLQPLAWLERQGRAVTRLPVDAEGRVVGEVPGVAHGRAVTVDAAPGPGSVAVPQGTALVSLMHSNNETGVLQPVRELAEQAHAVGALMHTDAAQSLGKVPVDVRALGVDLLSVAGHKLYAPKGVGALYVRRGVTLAPFARGASHERGLRPGTENVASIVGLGLACEVALRDLDAVNARVHQLRDSLERELAARVPGLALNGHRELRLPNTLNVRFPQASGDAVLAGAPEVAASTGSACHEGHDTASTVILAMGVPEKEALGSVRLTLGRGTTDDEVSRAAIALAASWGRVTALRGP